ncbi:MAG TPA: cytochrome c biogenesis protein ResB [Usitatibacter sp.]|nr:cytochrome c biogenesis protein ResB [Usitatibacter sp.]
MTLQRLASLNLTLAGLATLAAGAAIYAASATPHAALVIGPLALLTANLAAAVATNGVFRRDLPLMVFHCALLAVVVLAAVGRLTHFKGHVELAEGEVFDGQVTVDEAGALHRGALDRVRFVNDGFTIRYAAGLKRAETRNTIRVFDAEGGITQRVIGDNEPLQSQGYRFYTTFNKGFSLVFRWFPRGGGAPDRGTVNLPSYPANEHRQALEWKLPGSGPRLWTQLQFDKPPLDPDADTSFRKPEAHRVVLRIGQERWEIEPGQQVSLAQGVLAYEGLTTWMGYTVFYDWTMPWLIAACLTAIAALGWHFARKFMRTPWDSP